ncbi:putative 40S ribosomal protein S2 [Gregarina niphandrodes]|uniref:Small ribosomal subunit protein uS5 n=1 Tax=Gregarina niphandrodes TaxID=110365 RepID=A0A023B9H6_GRENI|nr:putative 40S ribosomal protein S2 [Gregarina niphandrodes]EZG72881.1 putative 40S ribosomal protein S2 [Gregarina niphandrodes]|eukprot:XP_011129740.1 putative 40S ribosomal protein S2 [Gregarina niphandrodes]
MPANEPTPTTAPATEQQQQPQQRGGYQSGFGGAAGGMGGGPRGPRPNPRRQEGREEWTPVTNLGRLVKSGSISTLDDIFLYSFAIKEAQIVDYFYARSGPGAVEDKSGKPVLHDEVMGIKPVQKQSASGQRTRFKAFVIVGDNNGHIGYGTKCAKEVATAIRGAIICAKLAIVPVRRGYWGSNIGAPHTVPLKVSGKCASVLGRLIPAPRGTGIVGSPIAKKVLHFAGVADCFTCSSGHTRTSGNFVCAYYRALSKTYGVLTPNLWAISGNTAKSPLDVYAKALDKANKTVAVAAEEPAEE